MEVTKTFTDVDGSVWVEFFYKDLRIQKCIEGGTMSGVQMWLETKTGDVLYNNEAVDYLVFSGPLFEGY